MTQKESKIPIICLVGATASGKTSVGVLLAKLLDAEIVSADSIQVYRELDIGSAKPTREEMSGIAHHVMDCVDIDTPKFSVSEYALLAGKAILDIHRRGKTVLVVGGTGLYIHALTHVMSFGETQADEAIRQRLRDMEAERHGTLHLKLTEVDPITAGRLHENDTKRLIRALEVYELTGKPLSSVGNGFQSDDAESCPYSPTLFGLTMPRETLYERINARVDDMMSAGLLAETERVLSKDYNPELPALQGLGYKQLIYYLEHKDLISLEETVETIKRETRRFAKRQMTWFRRDTRIKWFDTTEYADAYAVARAIYNEVIQ